MIGLPITMTLTVLRPRSMLAASVLGCGALGGAAAAYGVPSRNAVALASLAPLFGVAYAGGIVRGIAMRGLRRGGSPT